MQESNIDNPQIPRYQKYFYVLSAILLTGVVLILGQAIIKPLLGALVLALLLKPLCTWLEKFGIPRAISVFLSILLVFVLISSLTMFFSAQISKITSDLTNIEERLGSVIDNSKAYLEAHFGWNTETQIEFVKSNAKTLLRNSGGFLGSTISATASFFSSFVMFLMYLFFFLYYRTFLVSFLYKVFNKKNHQKVKFVLGEIVKVVRHYILGLLFVIGIIAVLNTIGLIIIGIEHAVFFGVLAALLTIIPYIGIFIGSILPIFFALVTQDSLWYPVGVLIVFSVVQMLEGNFITPNIVGDQVHVNPFAAILGLLIGGAVYGALGMILAIPVLAILKVVCDNIDSVKSIGYLIGGPSSEK